MVVFEQRWLYSGKIALFGQFGIIRAKVVVFGQKLQSCKMVVLGQKRL